MGLGGLASGLTSDPRGWDSPPGPEGTLSLSSFRSCSDHNAATDRETRQRDEHFRQLADLTKTDSQTLI